MKDNKLINNSQNIQKTNNIGTLKINGIQQVDNLVFIKLENSQNLLTDGNMVYDVSGYDVFLKGFTMKNKPFAIFRKGFTLYVINLTTNEVVFSDQNAYSIHKEDERVLYIIMKSSGGNNKLYDIEAKSYLPMPEGYTFDYSLGNGFYVFSEKITADSNGKRKSCIISLDGKVILKNILGFITLEDDHLIINNNDTNELSIIELKKDLSNLNIKTLSKSDSILLSPKYLNGQITVIEPNKIKLYNLDLELVKTISINGLTQVKDSEQLGDILKLWIPYKEQSEEVGKSIFINLKTGKKIEHLRLEGYPYWNPRIIIGKDYIERITDYFKNDSPVPKPFYFYDENFNLIANVLGTSYHPLYDKEEKFFIIINQKEKFLLNSKIGIISKLDYDFISFHNLLPYGYGVNTISETMDFIDEDLNIIFPNFDYKRYDLALEDGGFEYFIVNNMLCLTKRFDGWDGRDRYRTIILKSNGEVLLDTTRARCFQLGTFIEIIENEQSTFLNTITGERGTLFLATSAIKDNKINLSNNDFNNIFKIESDNPKLIENKNILMPQKILLKRNSEK